MNRIDRYRGCLLGLATGDAFGTTLEFSLPKPGMNHTEMVGGGPFNVGAGHWTDDTSMALCLAKSLIEMGQCDAKDQLDRYLSWRENGYMSSHPERGCFDIGSTTNAAIDSYVEANMMAWGPFNTEHSSAGNGSIMRLAPVPMAYAKFPSFAIAQSAHSSTTTHGCQACIDACRYFGGLIVAALNETSKKEILSELFCPSEQDEDPIMDHEIEEIAMGRFKTEHPGEIHASGYVAHTLEAALWSFYETDSFEAGLIQAVNLGEDADTVGAVYGQIAGAFYGVDSIPSRWINKLYMKKGITQIADDLLTMSETITMGHNPTYRQNRAEELKKRAEASSEA
tara:strand:+ start:2081 stop:3097 length:1017 start_codon:yes stop_codon:yes gene_type:complete